MTAVQRLTIVITIVLIFVAGGVCFYWFDVRPSQAVSKCTAQATDQAIAFLKTRAEGSQGFLYREAAGKDMYLRDDYEQKYRQCLREHGITAS